MLVTEQSIRGRTPALCLERNYGRVSAPSPRPLGLATTAAWMFSPLPQQWMLWLIVVCCSHAVYATNFPSIRPFASAHPTSTSSFSASAFVSPSQELLCIRRDDMNANSKRRRHCPNPKLLQSRDSRTDEMGDNQISYDETNNQPANIQLGDASNDFQLLIQKAIQTLVKSDTDGEELVHSYGSASQGLWLNPPAAKELQWLLDRVVLKVRVHGVWSDDCSKVVSKSSHIILPVATLLECRQS